jgi:hypothetical protein
VREEGRDPVRGKHVEMSDPDRPVQSTGPCVHYCHCGEWGGCGYASAPDLGLRWLVLEALATKRPTSAIIEGMEIAQMLGTKLMRRHSNVAGTLPSVSALQFAPARSGVFLCRYSGHWTKVRGLEPR